MKLFQGVPQGSVFSLFQFGHKLLKVSEALRPVGRAVFMQTATVTSSTKTHASMLPVFANKANRIRERESSFCETLFLFPWLQTARYFGILNTEAADTLSFVNNPPAFVIYSPLLITLLDLSLLFLITQINQHFSFTRFGLRLSFVIRNMLLVCFLYPVFPTSSQKVY